ncbi:MAG: AbrB/MazE/SpoVT family DNA-binding domain-containing protein [Bifidobacteriaceae bacterium]|jgi:AbrB family looped-hinge helix DNA binding protein|nr:AbrB/MazE/SpoVT family DNA-binding domain-containing protein [Bifidobacteriaceae bacterium]
MDVALVSANGQITVPASVRRELHLVPGDKIAFVKNEFGDITVVKPLAAALVEAQRAFSRAAAEAGLDSPTDVDQLVAEVRAECRARPTP